MIPSPSKVAVLGAGISGLSAAWHLKKEGHKVTLFEKEERPGGWIGSQVIEGFFFERGPHSLRGAGGADTFELIDELGLTRDLIWVHSKKRYLLYKGRLEPLPSSLWEALTSPLMKGVLKGLMHDLVAPRHQGGDESLDQFFSRRFSRDIVERFIDPLVSGIYAGDPCHLSVQACFPSLVEREKQYRSLILGAPFAKKEPRRGITTLKGGLATLTNKLAGSLKEELRLALPVERYEEGRLFFKGGSAPFDAVVSALPAHALAQILPEGKLKRLVQQIPFASLGVVHLGYRNKVNPYEGFGYLVPSSENEDILGVIFDSSLFPQQDERTQLTVMIGGTKRPDLLKEEALQEIAIRAVQKHLGIQETPFFSHSFIAKEAIAQYPVHFLKLLRQIQEECKQFPHFHLVGASFHGVSVHQAVASGKKAALLFP